MRYLIAAAVLGLAGSAVADTFNVPADYETIQGAVDAAVDGDEVVVAPGTYTSTNAGHVIDMKGKAITLRSSQGADVTIIDGEDARRGIACFSGETDETLIQGFTITNGLSVDHDYDGDGNIDYYENDGGGMLCWSASPTLDGCAFNGNTAFGSNAGGGLWCDSGSSPEIMNCTFSNNIAGNAGGIGINSSSPRLTACAISHNNAVKGKNGGETHGSAGGIWISNGMAELSLCLIHDNTAAFGGGGIWCSSEADLDISDCTISNNTADNHGGGIWIYQSNALISRCTIASNQSPWDGGVDCWDSSSTFVDCLIVSNTASNTTSYGGGGISIHFARSASLNGCTISSNTSKQDGGGILCEASSLLINDCMISSNTAGNSGGGVKSYGNSNLTLIYTTVCGNTPDQIDSDEWIDGGRNYIADECPDCTGDTDGNGDVNIDDLLAVIGTINDQCPDGCATDFDGDGQVTIDDLLIVIANWGPCE